MRVPLLETISFLRTISYCMPATSEQGLQHALDQVYAEDEARN